MEARDVLPLLDAARALVEQIEGLKARLETEQAQAGREGYPPPRLTRQQ